ncbi:hypothetical protein [Amycolatopsis sp. NPDC051071]
MWMVPVIPMVVMSFALLMERVEANVTRRKPSHEPVVLRDPMAGVHAKSA